MSPRNGESLEPLEPEDSEWLDAIAGRTPPGTSLAQDPPPDDPFASLPSKKLTTPGADPTDPVDRAEPADEPELITRPAPRTTKPTAPADPSAAQAGPTPSAPDDLSAPARDAVSADPVLYTGQTPPAGQAARAGQAGDAVQAGRAPVVEAGGAGDEVDPERLQERVEALARLVDAVGERLPGERLSAARLVVERAGKRLGLSGRHTVVALAGATGSGKSSLFNALSGLDLSRVGVRRPTTGEPHACVWDPADAQALLDWLGVLPTRRTARESALDADEQAELRGLVLVDLPDFDSIVAAHRRTVDRLVDMVDLVIWVLDPQKYADRVVHERYLRQLATRRTATVVVLNQVDRLNAGDAARCADDLRRLLAGDGLAGAPLYLTSVRSRAGIPELRSVLAEAVSDRQTALRRLAADVDRVAEALSGVVGPPAAEDAVDREGVRALSDAFARMIGVPGAADAAAHDYRRRGLRATSWLPARLSLPRRNATRQLHQDNYDLDWLDPTTHRAATTGPTPPSASNPADPGGAGGPAVPEGAGSGGLGRPLRALAERVGGQLPAPWRAAIRDAAGAQADQLRDRLERVVRGAEAPGARPGWWRVVNVAQWALAAASAAGLLWLVADLLSGPLGYDLATPPVGPLTAPTALFVGGLLLGLVLWLPSVPAVRSGAHHYRRAIEQAMRGAVTEAVREHVVAPVRAELHAYAAAHAAHQIIHSGQTGDRGRAAGDAAATT